ncbi:protein artemis [Anoplophora glabripennis]|uniref:protein artemis n=1 Tax=Anoplophora glabripennis TaxID=217634 RepID=UPI0008745FDB|nr:protein artemis [Anoplophora glabripennis]
MSTFSGKIQEISHISVDRFDENNLTSEAYFLSHCHYDHMVGLHTHRFQNNLLENNKYLYASEISCAILKLLYPSLKNNIKILDIYTPTALLLKGGNISVLPIPAGHCPGSVMFLFETNIRILYTGDYRINKNDIKKLKAFYDSYKQVKQIETIYLDTTFFLKSYRKFPKREESLEELCKIIKGWTDKGKHFSIKLFTSAKYGYEYMFNEIYKKTGMPVHVNREVFNFYSTIPEMDKSVTLDCNATQIHCSCGISYQYVCDKALNSKIRTIKVSAFRWTQDNLEDGFSSNSSETYYVCYATHASYEEGVELLKFLKPKSVEICVKHEDPLTNLEIAKLIEEVLDEFRSVAEVNVKHKLFETEENVSDESLTVVEEETIFNGFDIGILDSPPRNTWRSSTELQMKAGSSLNNNSVRIHSIQIQSTESVNDIIVQQSLDVVELESDINTEAPPNKKLK